MNDYWVGRRHFLGLGATSIGVAALSGCAVELPGQAPAPQNFRLTPKTTFDPDLQKVGWILSVAEPSSERVLDTNRIAVTQEGLAIDYYANATWTDRAPSLIQILLVKSFQASGAFDNVGTDRDRLRADYLLRSTLRAFQAQRDGDRTTIQVGMDTNLLTLPQRETVGAQSFSADQPTRKGGIEGVVLAFDEALGKVLKRIVLWTLDTGRANRTV